ALQAIEVELGFAMTQLALRSAAAPEAPPVDSGADDERTAYKPIIVSPDAPPVRVDPAPDARRAERVDPPTHTVPTVARQAPPEPARTDHAHQPGVPVFVDADVAPPSDVTRARRPDDEPFESATVGRIPTRQPETDVPPSEDEPGLSRRWVALAGALCALV